MGTSQCTASLSLYLPFTHLSAETPWCHRHASCLHTSIFCRINKRAAFRRNSVHAALRPRRSQEQQADASAPNETTPEAAAGCNWLNKSPETCALLTQSLRTAVAAAPSSLTGEKTNIWSLLIALNRGATEAKAVKNARVGALEMQPRAGRRDPRRFNCSPATAIRPVPPPPPGPDGRPRGRKSQVTAEQFPIQ